MSQQDEHWFAALAGQAEPEDESQQQELQGLRRGLAALEHRAPDELAQQRLLQRLEAEGLLSQAPSRRRWITTPRLAWAAVILLSFSLSLEWLLLPQRGLPEMTSPTEPKAPGRIHERKEPSAAVEASAMAQTMGMDEALSDERVSEERQEPAPAAQSRLAQPRAAAPLRSDSLESRQAFPQDHSAMGAGFAEKPAPELASSAWSHVLELTATDAEKAALRQWLEEQKDLTLEAGSAADQESELWRIECTGEAGCQDLATELRQRWPKQSWPDPAGAASLRRLRIRWLGSP